MRGAEPHLMRMEGKLKRASAAQWKKAAETLASKRIAQQEPTLARLLSTTEICTASLPN